MFSLLPVHQYSSSEGGKSVTGPPAMPRFLGIASSAVQDTPLPPLLVGERQVSVSDRVFESTSTIPRVPRLLASTLWQCSRSVFGYATWSEKNSSCPDASVIRTLHLSPTDIVIRLFCHGLDGRGGGRRTEGKARRLMTYDTVDPSALIKMVNHAYSTFLSHTHTILCSGRGTIENVVSLPGTDDARNGRGRSLVRDHSSRRSFFSDDIGIFHWHHHLMDVNLRSRSRVESGVEPQLRCSVSGGALGVRVRNPVGYYTCQRKQLGEETHFPPLCFSAAPDCAREEKRVRKAARTGNHAQPWACNGDSRIRSFRLRHHPRVVRCKWPSLFCLEASSDPFGKEQ